MNEDPNQTTQFEVSKSGVKVSSKRMSELVAILSMAILGVVSSFTWQLYKQVDALQTTIRAEGAETRVAFSKLEASNRYLACVVIARDPANCKDISR